MDTLMNSKVFEDKTVFQKILIFACILQNIGYGANAFLGKLAISEAYLLKHQFPAYLAAIIPVALGIYFFYAAFMMYKNDSKAFLHSSIAIFSLCLIKTLNFQNYFGLVLTARGSRFALPLVTYIFLEKFSIQKHIYRAVEIFLALTFISHGLKCLMHYETFNLYISSFLSFIGIGHSYNHLILEIIGIVDIIFAGFLIAGKQRKASLVYMLLWASIAACSRFFAYGPLGFFQVLIRAAYISIPLGLLFHYGMFEFKPRLKLRSRPA